MTPEERADVEAKADRCVRRGDLSEALALYRSILQSFPEDDGVQRKIDNLTGALQPAELMSPKAQVAREPLGRAAVPLSPEQEGERLFALGDYAGAAAAYRRALKEKPDSVLVRERLEELYRLARTAPRHSPTDSALPPDREGMLQALLDRIAARRKV